MKDVKYDPEGWGVNYEHLIDSMEFDEVLLEESYDGYHGDTYMLIRKGEQWGHLKFGWGSCSGCDAAQAVQSQQEATELRDEIFNEIRWFASPEDIVRWLAADHDLSWYGYDSTFRTYVTKAQKLLEERFPPSDEEIAAAHFSIQTTISKWAKEGW